MNNSQQRAVLYARFSPRPNAEDCDSVAKQLERMVKWCEAMGHTIIGRESDEGISGGRADNRPGLQRAIAQTRQAKGLLVVYSLDRLSRRTRDLLDISKSLTSAGANWASTTQSIDTSTPAGRMLVTVLGAMAQMQREETQERTSRVMLQHQKNGRRMGSICPSGWEPNCRPGFMQPNENELRGLERAKALRETGLGWRIIAQTLKAEGFTYRGGDWKHLTLWKHLSK